MVKHWLSDAALEQGPGVDVDARLVIVLDDPSVNLSRVSVLEGTGESLLRLLWILETLG